MVVAAAILSAHPCSAQQQPENAPPQTIPEAGTGSSLESLLAFAQQHSPVLIAARATRSRAEAERAASSVLLQQNPELSAGLGPRFGRFGTGLDADVGISQQLQVAGERRRRRAAAEKFAQLTDAEIEQIGWSVHCDVHAAFHRALVEAERMRLAVQVVQFQQEVLRIVTGQVEAGEVSPLNLRLAQAEVAQARQVLVAAEQSLLASRIRLAQLAGWPVTSAPSPRGSLDAPAPVGELEQLLELARKHLPTLRIRQATILEAAARQDAAARAAWLKPEVGVQYRREGNPTSEGSYDIVMGTISLPLPAFQRNQAERARALADTKVGEADLAAELALLPGRIFEARSEVIAAAKRVESYGTEIVPKLEENLTLLRRSFELGEIDLLALSVGRERFLRIQSDALSAHVDYFVALAALERVVGVDLWGDKHHSGEPAQ